jgi:predicted permease
VRNLLVVGEVALATALLVGSGLLVRSVQALTRVDPGFATAELSVGRVLLPEARYQDAGSIVDFWRRLGEELRARPAVENATVAQTLPLAGGFSSTGFQAEDGAGSSGDPEPALQFKRVGARYFETLGIPVLVGRSLSADDQRQDANTVVVSATAAAELWPGAPLSSIPGRRLRPTDDGPWYTVVGVSADVHEQRLDAASAGVVMFGFWGRMDEGLVALARSMAVAVRARPGAASSSIATMREVLGVMDGTLALADATTMSAVLRSRRARPTFVMTLSLVSAAVALILGLVGTYGVISYMVTRRTREIGVRVAMGARGSDIGALVLRLGLVLVGTGLVLGLGLAAVLSRTLRSVLFGVPALDPWTYVAVALLLALVGLLATVIPARRAARIPALEALRTE